MYFIKTTQRPGRENKMNKWEGKEKSKSFDTSMGFWSLSIKTHFSFPETHSLTHSHKAKRLFQAQSVLTAYLQLRVGKLDAFPPFPHGAVQVQRTSSMPPTNIYWADGCLRFVSTAITIVFPRAEQLIWSPLVNQRWSFRHFILKNNDWLCPY